MQFSQNKNLIRQVGPSKFVIGDNPLKPQMVLDPKNVHVPSTLTISGLNFIDYIPFTGNQQVIDLIHNEFTDLRFKVNEAFELDEEGDVIPSNEEYISDPMWILRSEDDLELRGNIWRHNTGPDAFTDEISF